MSDNFYYCTYQATLFSKYGMKISFFQGSRKKFNIKRSYIDSYRSLNDISRNKNRMLQDSYSLVIKQKISTTRCLHNSSGSFRLFLLRNSNYLTTPLRITRLTHKRTIFPFSDSSCSLIFIVYITAKSLPQKKKQHIFSKN